MISRAGVGVLIIVGVLAISGSARADVTVEVGSTGSVDLGEVWNIPDSTAITMSNPGGPVNVGTVSIGDGFMIVQDLCSNTTVPTGGVCAVLIGVNISTEAGSYSEQLVIADSGGAPLATVTFTMVKLDGFIAVSGTSFDIPTSTAFSPANSTLRITAANESQIELTLENGQRRVRVEMRPPFGETFVAGTTYTNTSNDPSEQSILRIKSDQSSCGGLGSFIVTEATADAFGELTAFEAEFSSGCSERRAGVDYGVVRFRREARPDPVIVGPTKIEHGTVLQSTAIRRTIVANTTESPVQLGIDDSTLSPFTLVGDGCPATLQAGEHCWLEYWLEPHTSPGDVAGSLTVTVDEITHLISLEGRRETVIVAFVTGDSEPSVNVARSIDQRAWLTFSPGTPKAEIELNYLVDSRSSSRLILTAPEGLAFSVGTFDLNSSRFDSVRLSISGTTFCGGGPSSITIHSVTQVGLTVTSMSADVRLGCNDGTDTGLAVRYNAPLNSAIFIPSVYDIDFGDLFSGTRVAFIRWFNVGDRASAVDFVLVDPVGAYRLAENGCRGVVQPRASCDQFVEFTGAVADYSRFTAELSAVPGHGFGSTSVALSGLDNKFHRPSPGVSGYWVLQADGTLTAFGDAADHDTPQLEREAIQIVSTPSGRGALVLDEDGNVHVLGDASSFGGLSDAARSTLEVGERPVTLSMSPSGWGYWIFTSRGRVFRFGDAGDIGDLLGFDLAADIIDSVAAPDGEGVYMIGGDGGVFALGGAKFAGSIPQVLPGTALNEPIVGIVPDPDGDGYWLVAADGGVFGFDAPFRGSLPGVLTAGTKLVASVNGMVPFGDGYLLAAADGGIFNFSDQPFDGSIGGQTLDSPVVSIASFAGAVSW